VSAPPLEVWRTARIDYRSAWERMRGYTDARQAANADVLWLLEHPAVYTLGQAGKPEHLLDAGDTPVVHSDRGGQVTWHGPGQCVAYLMLDLKRLGIGVRELVERIEGAVIALLAGYGIQGVGRREAPGVYVDGAKIAALGLRVRRGCSYHGLSFNVAPDLAAFRGINPCGFPGLAVTRLVDIAAADADCSRAQVETLLERELRTAFGYPAPPG
jgi:lipoyl(octanoyl) transferase